MWKAGQDRESYQSFQPSKDTCPIWQDQSCQQNEALTLQALGSQGMVHPDEKIQMVEVFFISMSHTVKEAARLHPKYG